MKRIIFNLFVVALATVALFRWSPKLFPNSGREFTPLARVEIGDTIPFVPLYERGGPGRRFDLVRSAFGLNRTVSFNRCTILVFFSPTCVACRRLAERWRGVGVVRTSSGSIPIRWVAAAGTDSASSLFAQEYSLPEPWYVFVDGHGQHKAGIGFWPMMYSIDEHGIVRDRQHFELESLEIASSGCA